MASKGILALALLAFVAFSGCKPSQSNIYGDSTGIAKKKGDEDLALRDVFARDLPGYRLAPERSDKYESYEDVLRKDPRLGDQSTGPVNSSYDIKEPLEAKLAQIRQARERVKQTIGYRILIYSGNNATRANQYVDTLETMMEPEEPLLEPSLPKMPITFDYVEPNYVVKIGNYLSRLEAHHQYLQLNREEFPQSLLVSEPIPIRKAMQQRLQQAQAQKEEEE